jgi:large subunit ribosomal protein L4
MAAIKSLRDGQVGQWDADMAFLGGAVRPVVLREAVLMYEANQRVGTASTKTRAEIAGSTKKMYKQKHTGRARHGDKKAPSFRKGGVAHGPHPRDYRYALPKKALRQALRLALAGKVKHEQLLRWEGVAFEKPSTKAVVAALGSLGADGGALLVAGGPVEKNLLLSVRNLARVRALPAAEVTAHDVVAHRYTVLLDGGLEALRDRLTVTTAREKAGANAAEGSAQ